MGSIASGRMPLNRLATHAVALLLAGIAFAHALPATAQATPVLQGAVARKVHGAVGTFDLPLSSVASNPTTEPRQGPTHTIVFTFDGPVTAGTAAITEGTATAGAPTFSGNDMVLPLTGVANAQYVTIAVSGVSTSGGGTGGTGSIRIGFLAGDVNQSRVVSVADLGLVNAQLAQVVTAANFLKDVNASGTLTVADKGITNSHLTQALAPPGDAAPTVVSTVPASGATNVALNTNVVIVFSEPVTVAGSWFQIVCTSGTRTPANTSVSGDLSATSGTTFTLIPSAAFTFADACTMTVFATGVSDNDALDPPDHMAADVVVPFTMSASNAPPVVQNDAAFTAPGAAVQFNVLANDSDPEHAALSVTSNGQGAHGSVNCLADGTCTYTPNAGFSGTDTFTYVASDGQGGTTSGTATITVSSFDTTLPAPPLDGTVATTVDQTAVFLYSGPSPVQTGVTPGTIQPTRASIIRGRVLARNGNVFPGATVTINGNTQFGQTISRANGAYDMAVNGARLLTVNIAAAGFITAQRQVFVPWQGYVNVPDVVLVPLDAKVTTITGNAGAMQVHQGSVMTDADGSRKATLLFPAGTAATMVMPDGSTQPLATMHVRATEFTVGAKGPPAMPGQLPPASAYTFAAEFSIDEAVAAGATTVTFNQPVPTYVENFLNFPAGTTVPSGFYDRVKGQWIPSQNGVVIKIVSITAGTADLDVTGDGIADTGTALTDLGITPSEQQKLATLYSAGQSLWRVPVGHFTAWDSNWPYSLPLDAQSPAQNGANAKPDEPEQDTCQASGSIIECQNQVVGERVGIVGTPYTLNYRSDRVPGHLSLLNMKLSGPTVPASLQSIRVSAVVGGQLQAASFPASPNLATTIVGNHLDAYGRSMQGGQPITATIDYTYPAIYNDPGAYAINRFGGFGTGVTMGANRSAGSITVSQTFQGMAGEGVTDARAFGLGGWMLSDHHFYDVNAHVMHLGGGTRSRARAVGNPIFSIAGTGVAGVTGNGIPALQATIDPAGGMGIGPDGALYFCNFSTAANNISLVRRVTTAGFIATIAGSPTFDGFNGDNILAVNAHLSCDDLTVGPDFSIYVSDLVNRRVRRITQAGIISTVAGNGSTALGTENVPATQTSVSPQRIAVGPEGNLYIAEDTSGPTLTRIRRVSVDGIVNTILSCATSSCGTRGMATGPDGSLYYVELQGIFGTNGTFIKRMQPNGVISVVAGAGQCNAGVDPIVNGLPAVQATLCRPYGLTIGPDETLYFADADSPAIAQVKSDGVMRIFAGTANGLLADNVLARDAELDVVDMKLGPDGAMYLSTRATFPQNAHIRKISASLPGFTNTAFIVASRDGREVYSFDPQGRHQNTRDALTGGIIRTFAYDAAGRLSQVTEKTGGTDNVTTIQHDGNGNPTKIVGPFGQQTLLGVDGNGFVAGITNPAGETIQLVSTAQGLLQKFTDPHGAFSQYVYDGVGLLTQATDMAGKVQAFVRTTFDGGYTVSKTTSLGRTTTYTIEALPGGETRLTTTLPSGESTQLVRSDDGTNVVTNADGTVKTVVLGPDPRFGMQAPFATSATIATPGGIIASQSATRTVSLSTAGDPFSLVSLTETTTENSKTTTSVYTASTRTRVVTTPVGRTQTAVKDALGRTISTQVAGLGATSYAYDARGRVGSVTLGTGPTSRIISLGYDAQGYLQSATDPLGRTVQYSRDTTGRATAKTLPGGVIIAFTRNAAGDVVGITPPGRPMHAFTYNERGDLTSITPPAAAGSGPTAISYNQDGDLTKIVRPGGEQLTTGFDGSGRVNAITAVASGLPTGNYALAYDGVGRVQTATGPGAQTVTAGYDGLLRTTTTWGGPVAGTVATTYDNELRVASETVTGAPAIAFAYDNDTLLTAAGVLAIVRNAQNGFPQSASVGALTDNWTFSNFGELATYSAAASGAPIYAETLTRDSVGRIAQKQETIGGSSDTFVYSYDLLGQLAQVTRNGAASETYLYDTNGNRVSATSGGTTAAATYDNQDRLLTLGSAAYTYSPSGSLATRSAPSGNASYSYDARGNLVAATLPGGVAVTYLLDGLDRRLGKRVNGTTTMQFLYSGMQVVAQLDSLGAVVTRFVYSDGAVPAYLIKGGTTYRVITDSVGSVRLVVDSATGAVAQRIDYDSFGAVTTDTNPGFQPFGFAGGLYDPDTRLVRFGARDYDAAAGRWTAKDPIAYSGNDTNLYRYSRNDPVNQVDPSGLLTFNEALDIAAGFFETITGPATVIANLPAVLQDSGGRYLNDVFGFPNPPVPSLLQKFMYPLGPDFDRSSAEYTEGEIIGDVATACVGIEEVVGFGGLIKQGLAKLAARAAAKEAAREAEKRLLMKEAREWAKAEAEREANGLKQVLGSQGKGGGFLPTKPRW